MTVQGKQPRHVSYKMSVAFPRYHSGQRSHEVDELICARGVCSVAETSQTFNPNETAGSVSHCIAQLKSPLSLFQY